jgi:hypothetical protein
MAKYTQVIEVDAIKFCDENIEVLETVTVATDGSKRIKSKSYFNGKEIIKDGGVDFILSVVGGTDYMKIQKGDWIIVKDNRITEVVSDDFFVANFTIVEVPELVEDEEVEAIKAKSTKSKK